MITEAIKAAGYATNDFQAAHIANGLRLYELPTEAEQLARVALYRRWRNKTDVKNDIPSKQAYDLAIAGIEPKDVPIRQVDFVPFDGKEWADLHGEWDAE
jgi:hypothetical protein